MKRRILMLGVTVTLVIGTMAMGSVADAAKPPIFDASGTVHCAITGGKVKITPGLTNTPTDQTIALKGKLACTTGQTGNAAVTVTSGKFNVAATLVGATCAALVNENHNTYNGDIAWKASGGKINATHVVWTSSGGNTSFDLPGPTGSGTSTGSYAGEHTAAHLPVDLNSIGKQNCGAPPKPKAVKKTSFTSASTLDVTP